MSVKTISLEIVVEDPEVKPFGELEYGQCFCMLDEDGEPSEEIYMKTLSVSQFNATDLEHGDTVCISDKEMVEAYDRQWQYDE